MSNLDRIVNIAIELQSVVSSGASFDNILIVGPAPKSPKGSVPDVGVYTDLAGVNEMGWVSEGGSAEPVGIAAETTLPTMRVNYFIREAFAAAYMQLAGTLY